MKRGILKILGALFLGLVNILLPAHWAIAEISQTERDALIALYNSTNGDDWTYNSGWKDGDGFAVPGTEKDWYGITCDSNNTTVLNIVLYDNQLSGSIPAELGNLTNLTILNLRNNQLTGSIPIELGDLANLEELYLYSNQLTGSIPKELGNLINLEKLMLEYNQLTGSIPKELGDLINLTDLTLMNNQLTGSIPKELGNLTNLTFLYLHNNQLSGFIPKELGNLTNLNYLWLSGNEFYGIIPAELVNLTNLSYLNICENHLYATDPDLMDFLDYLQPDWEDCQTPPPDSDDDGTPDYQDGCPNDPGKTEPGVCGCGEPDIDSEPDGMIDCWEIDNDLDPNIDDTNEDPDEDGFTNLEEYQRNTDPNDPNSHPIKAMPWLLLLLGDD